ncbi:imidazole glycerol phosphate synthase, glutamine amidotransferase subunit [Reichenbachiella sp. 5M10]|uniref:imidazole glycerol phosphate synthase subunit HisH n=1 Tax=Reichenbachiella sp. 5M10 TaxID=1889772 RepID=UPI000C14E39C|nr:imidazole glycerol phosphate synthase subunit HisH [Reichenbachiella sp. 5M10]PIB36775.1 imidazole glycerol phosphate synthase, glutamine amidotransferase subunit [Reichenbachiella sp. 5M10]
MSKVVIIDYGAGNVRSVKFALERMGITPMLSRDAAEIQSADKIIFPGVGEASSSMKALENYGLIEVIQNAKQPFLGICLGMQMMCESSEENNTQGLGIFPLPVKLFAGGTVKVPHMGWNQIEALKTPIFNGLEEKEYMYFVHSYYVPDSEWTIAKASYPTPFSAALHKDNFYGCQFHPEKSGTFGQQILKNFIEM